MTSIQDRVAQAVTPELIAAFREEGAVCIKGIFSPDEVAALRAGIDANLAHPSERAKVASRPDDPGWFFEDFCNWQHNDAYRDFIVRSPAPSVAAALMGTEHVRLHHDHLLVKGRHAAARHGTTSRTTTSKATTTSACGFRSIRCRSNRRWNSSPASRAVADAAHVHGQGSEVVPGRQPG